MSDARRLRCGDTAMLLREDGSDMHLIEVAYADYEINRASWCGWPEGRVAIDRLRPVEYCSGEEHRAAVARWLDCDGRSDHRRDYIERLYRPRAYAAKAFRLASERLDAARLARDRAHEAQVRALEGPEDA